jgi:hypothetical protein
MTTSRRMYALTAAAALAVLGACDVPTQAPIWDTSWQVPVNDDSIEVGQLLPGGITSTGVVFQVDVQTDSIRTSLGQLCGAPCAAVHGTTAALPAFTSTVFFEDSIPQNVLLVTPAPGETYAYELTNNLSFDPLLPQAGVFGMIVVGLVDPDSNIVGVDTLRGQALTFGVGSTLARAMALNNAAVGGPFQLAAKVIIPAGATVPIDTAGKLTVKTTEDSVGITSVRVVVDSIAIASFAREVDLTDLAGDVEEVVQSARIRIHIENPMAIAGGILVEFQDGIGNQIIPAKPLSLAVGASTQEVGLNLSEVLTLLAQGVVTMKVTGAVSGTLASNAADLHPDDVAQLSSRIFLTLRLNGED